LREKVPAGLRTAHLLRVNRYLDIAMIGMWMASKRAHKTFGMALACANEPGPGGSEEETLSRVRELVAEGREFYRAGDFPPAMARMRAASDLCSLRIIEISGE
jgi:hypothetical protein